MNIAIYTTAHGYGHASRSYEIAQTLVEQNAELKVYFISSAPDSFFAGQEHPRIIRRAARLDAGIRQIDSLQMDLLGTLTDLDHLATESESLISREAEALRKAAVSLVLVDLPFLAFEAATQAGVPAWGLSNFSWDWIYAAYLDEFPHLEVHIERIRRAYSLAEGVFRLPFHGGFDAFRQIVDIPLVARRSRLSKDEIRHRLGLEENAEVALFSFGGHPLSIRKLQRQQQVKLICTEPQADPGPPFKYLTNRWLIRSGLRYCDLVAAVDVVISKPGYGIVSECIANRTAMLYTQRGHFREFPILVDQMKAFIPAIEIAPADLQSGRWLEAYAELKKQPFPPPMDCNGADVVAEDLISIISGHWAQHAVPLRT
ncbi:MAG: hypothetical protein NTW14_14350 [bacterium]|nr:hypothetical protein [bacterium]